MSGRVSLRGRILQFCTQCIFDKHAPGGRIAQIRACEAEACPLYPVRLDRRTLLQEEAVSDPQETL